MQRASPDNIRTLRLFSGLSEQEKDNLIQAGRTRRYANRQYLFVYGDQVRLFHIVCDGAVQLFRETPDGHEMTSDIIAAGDTIGGAEILQSQATHRFNAIAVKDTVAIEFPIAWLKENSKRYSILALNLLTMLSRRENTAMIEAEHKATMTAPQQITCFLERLCILHDYDPHGFDLPYSKTLIASRLGMEIETFSRGLAKLHEHGITIRGAHVSFDEIEKMENYACSNCSISDSCQEHELLREQLSRPKPGRAECA